MNEVTGPDTGDEIEAPPHLRQMDATIVKAFADRTEALYGCIVVLENDLIYTAMTMRAEAQQFGQPWERTPHMAMRLVKALGRMTQKLTAAAELQLAGIASGLAADVEAAVEKGRNAPTNTRT